MTRYVYANVQASESLDTKAEKISFHTPLVVTQAICMQTSLGSLFMSTGMRKTTIASSSHQVWSELSDTVQVNDGRHELQSGAGRHHLGTTSSFVIRDHGSGGKSCTFCKGKHFLASRGRCTERWSEARWLLFCIFVLASHVRVQRGVTNVVVDNIVN